MLSESERAQIIEAVRVWVKTAPDEPVGGFLGGDYMTPSEIYHAMESNSRDGQGFFEIIEHGVRHEGLEKAIKRITARRAQYA